MGLLDRYIMYCLVLEELCPFSALFGENFKILKLGSQVLREMDYYKVYSHSEVECMLNDHHMAFKASRWASPSLTYSQMIR